MAYYTDTQIFLAGNAERVITVQSNGGSVSLQSKLNTGWIEFDVKTEDGSWIIDQYKTDIRIVPSGGAVYEFN